MSDDGLKLTAQAGVRTGVGNALVSIEIKIHLDDKRVGYGGVAVSIEHADRILSLLNGEAAQEPAKGPVRPPGSTIAPDAGDSTPGTETGT